MNFPQRLPQVSDRAAGFTKRVFVARRPEPVRPRHWAGPTAPRLGSLRRSRNNSAPVCCSLRFLEPLTPHYRLEALDLPARTEGRQPPGLNYSPQQPDPRPRPILPSSPLSSNQTHVSRFALFPVESMGFSFIRSVTRPRRHVSVSFAPSPRPLW